jgi:hypothetical protein
MHQKNDLSGQQAPEERLKEKVKTSDHIKNNEGLC